MLVATLGAAMPASAATLDAYLINVGDELELDILDDNDPPQRFTVGRDGAVQLPFIGGLEVVSNTVSDARRMIQAAYVDREIFVDPLIELSIASFRPISVLGDVRTPGNYDYQPFMTAEQAVGMAGGPSISANNEEARVLERRSLEGSLNTIEFDLALLAAQFARAQAQLKGNDSAVWTDVPQTIRPGIDRELFDEHRIEEDRIIALEAQDATTRRKLLTDAVSESENRISLLEQQEVVLTEVLTITRGEVTRVRTLADRGLIPKNEVTTTELRASQADNQLLQLREERSAARVQLAELSGRLSQFDAEREKQLLTEQQRFLSEIKKALSTRASLQDRMRLLQQWMNAASGLQTELLLQYQVRRRDGAGISTLTITPSDELLPGDLLVIVVKSPESLDDK
ncbi:polysaccharide biosynthesis/export family protein [Sulfitobacter sabulilitoris]|nr:polysaccharide biosynthesis/export family protein [Sulfitobacter sabulilitoris]